MKKGDRTIALSSFIAVLAMILGPWPPIKKKKIPYLRKKYAKLGTLLLSGAIMWLSKFIILYIFGISIAKAFKSRKFSKFFLSVDSSASSEPDFSMIT